jgi:hypothetical protein
VKEESGRFYGSIRGYMLGVLVGAIAGFLGGLLGVGGGMIILPVLALIERCEEGLGHSGVCGTI